MSEQGKAVSTILAVDSGGTFTDVVTRTGDAMQILKVPSTPDDPARAVLEGTRRALGAAGVGEIDAALLIHGSTVATNALLERSGARVALVTNRGFEDVLEIGRQNRPELYALAGRRPAPLVARPDRFGIRGRLGPDGHEEEGLDAGELAGLADALSNAGVEAVAVCLLHSYANPAHERGVGEALQGLGVPVTLSCELLPEFREYERTAVATANAYVAPRMARYLDRLRRGAPAARIRIMGSSGGALGVDAAARAPVRTILSGPAGGVIGARAVAAGAGIDRIITFDMGGTSTDVALCPGRLLHTRETEIAGVPLSLPMIDIHSVGAGGGSLAEVDAGGALRVGPRSAGAVPGPICYGSGGRAITVTDAHVWLGRLPADRFLGGERVLDREAIRGPLESLAGDLGTSPNEAAEGVLAVATTAMESALRVISVQRGYDPAEFTLVPFGGAAGLHAIELAARLGIPRVLLPPAPGVLSAVGMLFAPVRKDFSRTVLVTDRPDERSRIEAVFSDLEAAARQALREEGIAPGDLRLERTLDARYPGQSFELRVPADGTGWADAFHAAHLARYGYNRTDLAVEAVTLRVEGTGPAPAPAGAPPPASTAASNDRGVQKTTVFHGGAEVPAHCVDRGTILPGTSIEGPAIVTEYSATTWLPPGWSGRRLEGGSILLIGD